MIEVSTEKRMETETAVMHFSVLFWLIPRSTEKILDSFPKSKGD